MKHKRYTRGQHVFSEGNSLVDGVYFIIDGEFEVTQKTVKKIGEAIATLPTHNPKVLGCQKTDQPALSKQILGQNTTRSRSQAMLEKFQVSGSLPDL